MTGTAFLKIFRRNAAVLTLLSVACLWVLMTGTAEGRNKKRKEKVREFLQATVNLDIKWDVSEGDVRNNGALTIRAAGVLKLNREMSSMAYDLPAAMVCYKIQNMKAIYSYRETIIEQNPPEGCDPVREKYEGTGTTTCVIFPVPADLIMNHMASVFKNNAPAGTLFMNMIPKGVLVDQFMFGVSVQEVVIRGKERSRYQCFYKPSSRKLEINVNIIDEIRKNGKMAGKKTWTAKSNCGAYGPKDEVDVNLLPKALNHGKPFTPEESPNGDVTYTLSWKIERLKPYILIYRLVDGEWQDITDATPSDKGQKILPGERLTLRALAVIPGETQNPPKGKWIIKGKILKDWQASENGTKKIKAEKDKQEIEFYWWQKPPTGVVKYVVKSKGLTGKTTFKPLIPQVSTKEEPGSDWGVGNNTKKECELVPDSPSMKVTSTVSTPNGKPFCLEYVQLVKANNWQLRTYQKIGGPGNFQWWKNVYKRVLDTSYPYNGPQCSPGPFAMQDTPNAPFPPSAASIYWDMDFQTYLMFRPGAPKDGNAWVPLRRWHWGWKVHALSPKNPWDYYDNPGDIPKCENRIFPRGKWKLPKDFNYRARKAGDYPMWTGTIREKYLEPTKNIVGNYKLPPP